MHHYIGHEMYRSMGRYASRTQWIDLEINGVYMGVYQFMEKLKRDQNRIDIEKLTPLDTDAAAITGGYIIKIDKTAGGENGIVQPLEYFDNNWETTHSTRPPTHGVPNTTFLSNPLISLPTGRPTTQINTWRPISCMNTPRQTRLPMPKKSIYKAIFTTLKRRSLMMILPQMRVPIQTILTWIVL